MTSVCTRLFQGSERTRRLRVIDYVQLVPVSLVYCVFTWGVLVSIFSVGIAYFGGFIGALYSCFMVLLYVLTLWSYTAAVFTPAGNPSEVIDNNSSHSYAYLPTAQQNSEQRPIPLMVKNDGRSRFCQKCNFTKPDRSHHCSICAECVLKMDHHCPWLSTCIGFHNQKFFILFLLYADMFCFFTFLGCMLTFWHWVEFDLEVCIFHKTILLSC